LGKTVLIERTAALKYIKESGQREDGKHYLGKLAGIGADFSRPTRNGRKYPLELWRNVEQSEDFKEGMSTLTIFGEADHPETRIDTSIKEIAIVLTKFEIREMEGIVYTEFDILDTPNGRILKELLDYGSQIGVSSRGLGEEIEQDGETIVDPETYVFYGFDAVVMPAVVSARPAVVESANKLKDFMEREIENASCVSELQSLKKIAESVKIPKSVARKIDEKIDSLGGDNISPLFESEIENLVRENEELKKKVKAADNIRRRSKRESLKESQYKRQIAELREAVFDGARQISYTERSYQKELSVAKRQRDIVEKTMSKVLFANKKLQKEVESLSEGIDRAEDKAERLRERLDREQQYVAEIDAEQSNIADVQRELQEARRSYLTLKCKHERVDEALVESMIPKEFSLSEVDAAAEKVKARNRNLSKLPYVVKTESVRVLESPKLISDEDEQTIKFLENYKEGRI